MEYSVTESGNVEDKEKETGDTKNRRVSEDIEHMWEDRYKEYKRDGINADKVRRESGDVEQRHERLEI